MVTFNPNKVALKLDSSAYNMIRNVVDDAPAKQIYIKKFLNDANSENLSGASIVSYFTAFNRMKARSMGFAGLDRMQRIDNVYNLLEKEIKNVPELKKQANEILERLNKAYGDKDLLDKSGNVVKNGKKGSLVTRILLARDGAVVTDKVEPRSKLIHSSVAFERFCINTIDKIKDNKLFQKVVNFFKQAVAE